MRRQSFVSLMMLAVVGAGCGADQAEQRPPAVDTPAAAGGRVVSVPEDAARQVYSIDAEGSEVYWLISKAGLMARFGHNHVISAESFTGTVEVDPGDPAASRFELEIPVADLVIDDPALRSRLGEEFASVPSEEDKDGTRQNMLGENLLEADMYPAVRVRGGGPRATDADDMLPIEIEILGESFGFDVPGEVAFGDGDLVASGEFALDHADLGLTPFSALGGALQVGPTIEFSYRIRAVQAE